MEKSLMSNLRQINLESLVSKWITIRYRIGKKDLANEVRKFFYLLEKHDFMLAPSEAVDEVVHKLLENSPLRKEVEKVLGGKLDHDTSVSGQKLENMYSKTLKLYKKEFVKGGNSVSKKIFKVWW